MLETMDRDTPSAHEVRLVYHSREQTIAELPDTR
jgi:hypothetical protein